jgi:hypothetical protein
MHGAALTGRRLLCDRQPSPSGWLSHRALSGRNVRSTALDMIDIGQALYHVFALGNASEADCGKVATSNAADACALGFSMPSSRFRLMLVHQDNFCPKGGSSP